MFGKKPIMVTAGRTMSVNYQSRTMHLNFELPDGVTLTQGLDMADFIIQARLTRKYKIQDRRKHATTYEAVFNEPIDNFLEHIEGLRGKTDE